MVSLNAEIDVDDIISEAYSDIHQVADDAIGNYDFDDIIETFLNDNPELLLSLVSKAKAEVNA